MHYDDLAALISEGNVVILSGAGLSTESGIPDYRGATGIAARGGPVEVVREKVGLSTESGIPDYRGETGRARPATPMTYQVFTGSAEARQRYWSRSHVGWRFITGVDPNDGHRAVAALQDKGLITGIITQNVDGLHQRAGATDVVELHGALDRVVCLQCHGLTTREELDTRLRAVNPDGGRDNLPMKPDGDVELEDVSGFVVVGCVTCGGLLKPDVVFFGETVPKDRVDRTFGLVSSASCLLVLGSSLKVMSGYRFVLHARKLGIPVAIVNQGETRGDAQATLKLEAPLGATLTHLAGALQSMMSP